MEVINPAVKTIDGPIVMFFKLLLSPAKAKLFAKRAENLKVLIQRLPLPANLVGIFTHLWIIGITKFWLIASFWAQQYANDRKVFSQILFSTFCAYFGEVKEAQKTLSAMYKKQEIVGGQIGGQRVFRRRSSQNESFLKSVFWKFLHMVEPDLDLPQTSNFLDCCAGLMGRHTSPLQTLSERSECQNRSRLGVFANLRRLLETVANPDKLPGQSTYLSRQYLVDEWHLSETDLDHPFCKIEGIEERWSDVEQIFKYLSTGIHEYESIDGSLGLREGDFSKQDAMILKGVWDLLKQHLDEGIVATESERQSEAEKEFSRKRRESESEPVEHGWLPMGPKRRRIGGW